MALVLIGGCHHNHSLEFFLFTNLCEKNDDDDDQHHQSETTTTTNMSNKLVAFKIPDYHDHDDDDDGSVELSTKPNQKKNHQFPLSPWL